MTIFVNSYLGHLEKTVIGRVYVEDKDDWDLPDKVFSWAAGKSLPGFSLAVNGEVILYFESFSAIKKSEVVGHLHNSLNSDNNEKSVE